jgi:hypothetical protein
VTETPFAFTYGLTLTELCRAPSLTEERLLDRVGLPWIINLDTELAFEGGLPPLRDALADLGISRPGQESAERWLPSKPTPALDQAVIDALAGPATQRVREFIEHELTPFATDLEAAAPGHKPSPELVPLARRFAEVYGRPLKLVSARNRRNGKTVWGPVYDRLLERIASELMFLYEYERPTLKRCVLCGAVFVSREGRANCSWTLWDGTTHDELLGCSPPEVFENWSRQEATLEHRRTRKRLTERIRQERRRANGNEQDARVIRARKDRDEYMKANRRRRGRAQPISPAAVDVVREMMEPEPGPAA